MYLLNRNLATSPAARAAGPIGLDLGVEGARLVQLAATGGAPAVRAAAACPHRAADGPGAAAGARPAREILRDLVQRALDSAPFIGRRVVAAVPADLLHVRTVRVADPAAGEPGASLASAARAESAALFPFDLRDALVQFLPAGLVRQAEEVRREVIVLAAPKKDLDRFVADLHAAGVVLESLDAGPCALFHSAPSECAADPNSATGPGAAHVRIDVGRRQTQVVIGRGGGITFIKSIDVGAQNLDQAVVRKLGVTAAEARLVRRHVFGAGGSAGIAGTAGGASAAPFVGAGHDAVRQALSDATRAATEPLARGLASYLRYHAVTFRGPGPGRVELYGAEADNELLRSSLAAMLGLPVVPGDPFAGLDAGALRPADRAAAPQWAVAVGLALKKLPRRAGPQAGPREGHWPSAPIQEAAVA